MKRRVIGTTAALLACFFLGAGSYLFYWRPSQLQQKILTLPAITNYPDAAGLGVLIGSSSCGDLRPDHDLAHLKDTVEDLRRKLASKPDDLCVGNQYRQGIRFLTILQKQFAISPEALPSPLAGLAQNSTGTVQQLALTEDAPADNDPATAMPVKTFIDLTRADASAALNLQLGLSYVDLMIREGGREQKARLSSLSIERLSQAIQENPNMVGALYGRGLNYLYWPSLAGKLPLAIADLKRCIALSEAPSVRDQGLGIFAEAYTALGDSYVKAADTSVSSSQRASLLRGAREWWRIGGQHYPGYARLDERLALDDAHLIHYVEQARGLETYIDTDLHLLWDQPGKATIQ